MHVCCDLSDVVAFLLAVFKSSHYSDTKLLPFIGLF